MASKNLLFLGAIAVGIGAVLFLQKGDQSTPSSAPSYSATYNSSTETYAPTQVDFGAPNTTNALVVGDSGLLQSLADSAKDLYAQGQLSKEDTASGPTGTAEYEKLKVPQYDIPTDKVLFDSFVKSGASKSSGGSLMVSFQKYKTQQVLESIKAQQKAKSPANSKIFSNPSVASFIFGKK